MIDLSYFEDEDGNIKPRPKTCSIERVERVKNKPPHVVKKFVCMYLDGLQWDWLEEFKTWEKEKEDIEAWNAEFSGTEAGVNTVRVFNDDETVSYIEEPYYHEAVHIDVAPVRPPVISCEDWCKTNADKLRSYPPIEEQLDQMFHDYDGWLQMVQDVKDRWPKQ